MIDTIAQLERRVSALETGVNAVVRVGIIVAVQRVPYHVQVDVGTPETPTVTGWVPAVVPRAGQAALYSLLSVGERCLLLSPGGGDVSYALPALFSTDYQPGALAGAAETELWLEGDLVVSGRIVASGEVKAGGDTGGVSLLTHTHPPGGGPPVRTP